MDELSTAFAKLAGTRKALDGLLALAWGYRTNQRPYDNFESADAAHHFEATSKQLEVLRRHLPDLFGDFPPIDTEPKCAMAMPEQNLPNRFHRDQILGLARAIDQIFEIRSHSELAAPAVTKPEPRVFISHGRTKDWLEVQAYIEKDVKLPTLELAQEANMGRTVLGKLVGESDRCTSAVIVMTGDDIDADGTIKARENVMHEIGYFQGKFGLAAVCLLHEEGTNVPTNIQGLVYAPFPKGMVSASFTLLHRELRAFYKL